MSPFLVISYFKRPHKRETMVQFMSVYLKLNLSKRTARHIHFPIAPLFFNYEESYIWEEGRIIFSNKPKQPLLLFKLFKRIFFANLTLGLTSKTMTVFGNAPPSWNKTQLLVLPYSLIKDSFGEVFVEPGGSFRVCPLV